MFLHRSGKKVDRIFEENEFVDIGKDDFGVEDIYAVEVCAYDTDCVYFKDTFYEYPNEEQLKWCLWKGQKAAGDGIDVYAKVAKRYRLVF